MSWLTESELDALNADSLIGRDTPFGIRGVSNTQLSIARHYGCIKFNGQLYTYFPATDELIRDDVLHIITKQRKATGRESRKAEKQLNKAKQEALL